MPRAIWKGAISFGLVHVPVALYPASSEGGIDFDWLDKRSMDPVGYKRINKRTGKEIDAENIVRGVKLPGGDYVVLGDEEIKAAYPRTTQTIALEAFVDPTQVPFTLLEKPFYLEPQPKADKVYALLREAMRAAGVIGIARVVMHTKEHLAALIPDGPALMLDTLRWAADLRPADGLQLPPAGARGAGLTEAELKMARRLIDEMKTDWQPAQYEDKFTHAVQALVEQRAAAGRTEAVQALEEAPPADTGQVIDLTELLKRSLQGGAAAKRDAPAKRSGKPAAKKSTARPAAKTQRRA